jgi:hypothetical protein
VAGRHYLTKAEVNALYFATHQTAMLGGQPFAVLRDAILKHPTMAEGLNALFAAIPAR